MVRLRLRARRVRGWMLGTSVALVASVALPTRILRAGESCEQTFVALVTVQGGVEIQRANATSWTPAETGDRICDGDSVRVGKFGGAAVRLPDGSNVRLRHNTFMTFELEPAKGGWLLDLLRGALHVISRDPRALRFSTPHFNAGLEGTEFLIEAREDRAEVVVVEGEVAVTAPNGGVDVRPNQLAAAGAGVSPATRDVESPIEYSRWASYYPPIIDGPWPDPDRAPTAAEAADPAFFAARAAARAGLGRADLAEEDLAAALGLAADHPAALAMSAVAALVGGRTDDAERLARTALDAAPESVPALLASSHVLEAARRTEESYAAALRATSAAPGSALAWSRRAELELATERVAEALRSAARATALDPRLARPNVVRGFAALRSSDRAGGESAFRRAIELDSDEPLARLGLAIALLARGATDEARLELESAVVLNVASSALRSYVGKLYDFENRRGLAATQLDLAKDFDRSDPTPWLYEAAVRAAENRPVEALAALRRAEILNASRTPFRSTLDLDEDLAVRSSGHATAYRDLGFEDLAIQQGAHALIRDPTDYSTLRLLSSIFTTLPRHEVGQVSALHQATLNQPLNASPTPAQAGEATLFLLDQAGPSDLILGEYSPLYAENGVKLQASVVGGSLDTSGHDVVLAGLHDRLSYNLSHLQFQSDGFRANNDIDQRVSAALLQARPSFRTTLQLELRSTYTEHGDLLILADPSRLNPQVRTTEEFDTIRFGVRHEISPRGSLLASLIYQDIESQLGSPAFLLDVDLHGYILDLQHVRREDRWTLTSGLLHFSQDRRDDSLTMGALEAPRRLIYDQQHDSLYSYAQIRLLPNLALSVGASADSVTGLELDRNRLNPKLGIVWDISAKTTLRAAAFGTLQGALATEKRNLQPRLEPVVLAGFNQFFVDQEGDSASFRGVALHHEASPRLFFGGQLSTRDVQTGLSYYNGGGSAFSVDEQFGRAYAYWAPTGALALAAEYRAERIESAEPFLDVLALKTRRLPIEIKYFHPTGLRAGLRATRVVQRGRFDAGEAEPSASGDRFWTFDGSIGYRLRNRRGLVSLNVDNLLDEDFRFQDTDPMNPSIPPERMAYLRFTLAVE